MRVLGKREMYKRGCEFCLDCAKKKAEPDSVFRSYVCIHDECPYHELDNHDSYTQYLKHKKGKQGLKETVIRMFDIERDLRF